MNTIKKLYSLISYDKNVYHISLETTISWTNFKSPYTCTYILGSIYDVKMGYCTIYSHP